MGESELTIIQISIKHMARRHQSWRAHHSSEIPFRKLRVLMPEDHRHLAFVFRGWCLEHQAVRGPDLHRVLRRNCVAEAEFEAGDEAGAEHGDFGAAGYVTPVGDYLLDDGRVGGIDCGWET